MRFGDLHRREDLAHDAAAVLERPLRVVVDAIRDPRPRHADRIAPIEVGDDAILRQRQLLGHRHEAELARAALGQRAIELGAAQTALNQIAHRAVRRAHRPCPAAIVELNPEGGVIAPPVPGARRLDARGRQAVRDRRPAARRRAPNSAATDDPSGCGRPDRSSSRRRRASASVRDCSSNFGVSMPCAAITNTLPVARSSLPSGRLTMTAADAAVGADLDARDDGVGHQLRAGTFRLRDVRGGVVLRLDGTDRNAAAAAAARRAIVVALRVPRLRRRLHRVRRARQRRGRPLIGVAERDRRQRIRLAARRVEIGLRIAGDAELALGFAVPRFEIVVRDRPVDADAESRAQPEIVRHETQRRARASATSCRRPVEDTRCRTCRGRPGDSSDRGCRSPDAARTACPGTDTPGS